jgi:hypothetical protein
MTKYYSVKADGFYNSDSGVTIPDDAIELTDKQYEDFLTAMNTQNKMLVLENDELVLKTRIPNITWNIIRQKRNRLLSQSDYTQMPDWPGDKKAWAEYRQALRDITSNFSNPNTIIWPKTPT